MAIIIYLEPQEDGKRLKVITRAEAEKLIYAMNHPELVTDEAQLEKLARIQDIHLGRSGKPAQRPVEAENTLFHPGIAQGSYQALPTGDRD